MTGEEMLGKVVKKLVPLASYDGDNLLGVILDILEKATRDSTHNPWPDELKRFARKEPCWTPTFIKRELERYLAVARMVLLGADLWTESSLVESMQSVEPGFSTWDSHHYLHLLESLKVIEGLGRGRFRVCMAPQEFENRFNVKLPH